MVSQEEVLGAFRAPGEKLTAWMVADRIGEAVGNVRRPIRLLRRSGCLVVAEEDTSRMQGRGGSPRRLYALAPEAE